MVKRIFISLEDSDFDKLKDLKGQKTWLEFLVEPHLKREAED